MANIFLAADALETDEQNENEIADVDMLFNLVNVPSAPIYSTLTNFADESPIADGIEIVLGSEKYRPPLCVPIAVVSDE